jgi:hypothetical protein
MVEQRSYTPHTGVQFLYPLPTLENLMSTISHEELKKQLQEYRRILLAEQEQYYLEPIIKRYIEFMESELQRSATLS